MENTPEAAGAAQAPQTEATPNTNTNEPAKAPEAPAAPDMHGFTSEQLADMQKFFAANGGFDKVKARISNPEQPSQPAQPNLNATDALEKEKDAMVAPTQSYHAPEGAISRDEYFARRYFLDLADNEKYANIADDIASGEVLKEMNTLGIQAFNPDNSINEKRVLAFLDMKSKTVPAKQTSSTPEASAAPTVDYVPVGETIKDAQQARDIIMQDTQLRMRGAAGHPRAADAEAFLRNLLSPNKK